MTRLAHLIALCIAATVACSLEARAQGHASGGACWSTAELAGKPGEKAIHRETYDPTIEPRDQAEPLAPVAPALRGSIRSVKLPPGEKLVALTFDLCENAWEVSGYDASIFDTLRKAGVKATFFASGKWLMDHSERAQQLMADPLFEVGAHSWTHRNFRLLPPDEMRRDLSLNLNADGRLRRELSGRSCYRPGTGPVDASRPLVFRFPFGTCNTEALDAVNDAGLLAIQWDIPTGDPAPAQSADAIAKSAAAAKPGSIIVMHANGRGHHTAEALPHMIDELRKRGFGFATVSELIAKGAPVIKDTCYELKPGDNVKYDKLFPAANNSAQPPAAAAKHAPAATGSGADVKSTAPTATHPAAPITADRP
ncbi:polysaccharide deacetylase [Rhodomicrobium udaipurense JA643]|uniref:Chitooligosaccharide deacetylase n=1 Tax=Rhodomicrobium udaipurense TaxID=1202716 RepID=A0A8I1KKS0_9HYPH|nr:polysaccharide deacetylase family protein [Rhodomicrobium udaipurense]KAI93705.1 polysaccharide deacetylase [Rhodomicrobium udaipurense JA643]MBJ7544404.1 polysaccharide deacetylase family protein [Rhodomicrobium udaipurense]